MQNGLTASVTVDGRDKKPARERCALYVMTCHTDDALIAKVGISKTPKLRLSAVQTGCPLRLDGLYLSEFRQRDDARSAEQDAHAALWKFRTRGEWFRVPSALIDEFFAAVERAVTDFGGKPLERVHLMMLHNFNSVRSGA